MEIGKLCRDTTTIPDNSSTKRGYMRGVAYIYITCVYVHICIYRHIHYMLLHFAITHHDILYFLYVITCSLSHVIYSILFIIEYLLLTVYCIVLNDITKNMLCSIIYQKICYALLYSIIFCYIVFCYGMLCCVVYLMHRILPQTPKPLTPI